MNRRIAYTVALLSVLLLLLAGCASQDNGSDDTADPASDIASDERPLPTPGNEKLPGLTETKDAWLPENSKMPDRVGVLGFPPPGDEAYHIHTLLTIYVDGKQMPVPNEIGLSQAAQFMAAIHTHDATGVIHYEAAVEFPFTLGDVFATWGVVLTDDQVGGYKSSGDKTVQVFVNGKQVDNVAKYQVKTQDNIVVAYGKKDSFPKNPPADALAGNP